MQLSFDIGGSLLEASRCAAESGGTGVDGGVARLWVKRLIAEKK
jgi:hypothetical protein